MEAASIWQSCLFQPRSLLLLLLLLSQDPASPAAGPNGGTWARPTVDTAMSAKMMVMLLHHQCPILCPILPAVSPLPPCRSRLTAVGATNGRRPIRYLAIPSFQRVRGLRWAAALGHRSSEPGRARVAVWQVWVSDVLDTLARRSGLAIGLGAQREGARGIHPRSRTGGTLLHFLLPRPKGTSRGPPGGFRGPTLDEAVRGPFPTDSTRGRGKQKMDQRPRDAIGASSEAHAAQRSPPVRCRHKTGGLRGLLWQRLNTTRRTVQLPRCSHRVARTQRSPTIGTGARTGYHGYPRNGGCGRRTGTAAVIVPGCPRGAGIISRRGGCGCGHAVGEGSSTVVGTQR